MFTAIYVRVSTGMQASEGTSLDGQYDICLRKSIEMGIPQTLIRLYKEEGFTGEDIDRPAMNDLRRDVALGKITRLIITHPDRLTRDLTDKLILCRELERYNIELQFVDTEYRNTPEGQLFFNLMSSIAQYELSLIKKRTIRGRLNAVGKEKKIMPMRVPPFGYDYVDHALVINKQEAMFVKKIYDWYVYDHLTLREIGERLYALGAIPKRRESKNWSASSIRRILTSEIYIGRYFYNRRKTRKLRGEKTKSGSSKKTFEFREEKDWIEVQVPHIIDSTLFEMAQKQKKKNTKKSGNVKYEYLLKSLIRCGHCGRLWQSTTYKGRENKKSGEKTYYTCYRCPNLFPKKYGEGVMKCPSKTLRAEILDEYVWGLIFDTLSNPNDYLERLKSENSKVNKELQSAITLLNQQLDLKEKEKEKIKIMFKRDVISEIEMSDEMQKVNFTISEIQREVQKYKAHLAHQLEKNVSDGGMVKITKRIDEFTRSQGSQLSIEHKRSIVEAFIDEILIKFEGNEVQITAIGVLDDLKRQQYMQYGHGISLCSQPQNVLNTN